MFQDIRMTNEIFWLFMGVVLTCVVLYFFKKTLYQDKDELEVKREKREERKRQQEEQKKFKTLQDLQINNNNLGKQNKPELTNNYPSTNYTSLQDKYYSQETNNNTNNDN